MAEVTSQMVAALREKTGAGFMDCKKALVESNGVEAEAIELLRKKGVASAAKKSGSKRAGRYCSFVHSRRRQAGRFGGSQL